MQFDLISYPGIGLHSAGTVFDLHAAKRVCRDSTEAMEHADSELADSTVVYDAMELVLKLRFYVDERPPDEIVARTTSRTTDASLCLPSGLLCAGWAAGFPKPDMWVADLGYEDRDGFRGQFQQIEPGQYRVDLFGMLAPPAPTPKPSPPRWYDSILAAGCVAGLFGACALMWLPIASCVAALLFWDWRFLFGVIPYALITAATVLHARKLRAIWREAAEEFRAKAPDVVVVLTKAPQGTSGAALQAARVTRPGIRS